MAARTATETLQAGARMPRWTPAAALVVGAVALAGMFWLLGNQPIVYDAEQYVRIGRLLLAGQFEGWESRTYGYPAFLAPWLALAGGDLRVVQGLVFVAQLAVHLGAAWLFARRVARAFGDDRLGRVALVLVALNPFLLILTGVLIADLLSASLIAVGVALLLPTKDDRPADVVRDGMLGLAALAFAAEVRPANAILLPIGALLWTARWWTTARADLRRLLGGFLLVGTVAALPLVPQMLLNWREHGQPHPLTVRSLYAEQIVWGLENLKYATLVPRSYRVDPSVFYRSPFWDGATDLGQFALSNPAGLAATLALHTFALADQDAPFPYMPDVAPWYRWPLSVLNYLFVWAAAVGLVVGGRRWLRSGTRLAWAALLLPTVAYVVIYLPTAVESRFGAPVFILLAPAAAATLLAVADRVRARAWRPVAVAGAGALLTVLACAWLSVWMQSQAPTLVMLREVFRAPGPEPPVATIETAPPDRWVAEQPQTFSVRATNLGERTWYAERPAQVYLHVMFVGPGDAETVDSRVEAHIPVGRRVPPGGQVDLEVSVAAPRKEGTYRLRQQLELDRDLNLGLSAGSRHETRVVVEERRSGGGNRQR